VRFEPLLLTDPLTCAVERTVVFTATLAPVRMPLAVSNWASVTSEALVGAVVVVAFLLLPDTLTDCVPVEVRAAVVEAVDCNVVAAIAIVLMETLATNAAANFSFVDIVSGPLGKRISAKR